MMLMNECAVPSNPMAVDLLSPQRLIGKSHYPTIDISIKPATKRENFFAKLKQFRAIATRYDKTARNFLGAIYLAASVIWLN